jgi:hypothetical protein
LEDRGEGQQPLNQALEMLEQILKCIREEDYFYTRHARHEMETEELGEIRDDEVVEAILSGKIIEDYPENIPYPSCLIYGRTSEGRPIHAVCAYADDIGKVIIITAYEPSPNQWTDFERRRQ